MEKFKKEMGKCHSRILNDICNSVARISHDKKQICDVGSMFERLFWDAEKRVTKMIEDLRQCDNDVMKETQHPDGQYSWGKYRTNRNKLIVKKE